MSFTNIIEWVKNFISSLFVPAIISTIGAYLDSNIADAADFGVEISTILPQTWNTYFSILISPSDFFRQNSLNWNFQYFGTALALAAFAFSYLVPPIEYAKTKWLNWVIKILFSKIAGIIHKGGLLLLSSMYFFIYVLIFSIIALLFGQANFSLHYKLLFYSFGTVYITFSLTLFLEHLVTFIFQKKSILKCFAHIIAPADERSEKERECIKKIDQESKARELKMPGWMRRFQNEKAIEGRKKGALFLCIISTYQRVLIYCLLIFLIVYPFFCLGASDI